MKYDITVIGSCSIDNIFYSNKEEPDIIVPGGKGANQAIAASRASSKVSIISIISKDNLDLLTNLKNNKVNTSDIELVSIPNDVNKIYFINSEKHIERTINTSNLFTIEFINRHLTTILNSKMVLIQTKIPKETTNYIINICYKNNIPIILTPSHPDNFDHLLIDKISYITANRKECLKLFNSIEEALKQYPNKLIVTLGNEGVTYFNGNNIVKYPSLTNIKVEDTTGAGDTFTGNLASLLVEGKSLDEAIKASQCASILKIQKKSSQNGMPTKEERDSLVNSLYK